MPLLSNCFACFKFKRQEVIDKLDYSNTPLQDAFPEVWQHERTLEELHLSNARLQSLPPQLFYCQGLRVLQVNSNNLESIPQAIGSLRQLQHLDLNRNLIVNVPEEIKACKHLTHLDLSCNSLQRLPDAITSLISLQELLLNETYLEFLPANFGRLVNLRILEVRLNNLITLPKSIVRLINLQRLDIGGNEFTELPEVIGELKSLRELWIDFNQIRRVSPNIGKLRELQHFEANGNLLDALPNELSNWRNVEVLSVCSNNLEAFPFSVGMLKSLVTFKCESNGLSELPDSISYMEQLEELVLSHNKLMRLPNTIGSLAKLRFLFADDNQLRQLPDELCSCSQLSVVSVANNQLSALPQNVGHLSKLKVLNVVNNYINTLPVSMLSLVNLTSLWLSDNQSQPLVPLQYLDASNKTQLTCFMLPQVAFKMQAQQQKQQQQQQVQEQYEFVYANHHQQQQPSSPSRRICFAEETTVLSAATAATNAPQSAPNYAASFVAAPHTPEQLPAGSSVRLMRSPTPYPKELRQMAKYMRQAQAANAAAATLSSEVREARVVAPNGVLPHCDTNQDAVDHAAVDHEPEAANHIYGIYQQQQHQQPQQLLQPAGQEYYGLPLVNYETHYQQLYVDASTLALPTTHLSNGEANYELQALQQSPPAAVAPPPRMDPPPYHIARVYTKKTAEDLTLYESMRQRKQQQQQQLQQLQQQQDATFYEDSNSYQDALNSNLKTTAIGTQAQQLDYQNNIHMEQQELQPLHNSVDNGDEQLQREQQDMDDTLSQHSVNSTATNNTSRGGQKRSTWIFGVHKNPTVKQVTLKWEQHIGFDIAELLNQVGIYVSAITPNSSAARLLSLNDKLLEIDGYDLTNANLSDAKRVLHNCGAVINIMLSRK
ncbi:Lap1 [Drosophila busckii]|uniref:Lap1 n=1 Tax=Drosophila busckii TaxID=30019 RepID=A0A0M4EJ34_DROBS|nr:protein lap1 [Drosophila busckii]ALC41217.1 Lap1 [Drosophila busckii]